MGCDPSAFWAASVLPAGPSEQIGRSAPTNISICSRAKPAPAGAVSFAWEGIKILLSKSLLPQTSFEIWAQHRFNMMLLAFPEACSRKVSYIKLAAIMFGLIDFFFNLAPNIQKAVKKKKSKRERNKKGKTCTQLRHLPLSTVVSFSKCFCSKMYWNKHCCLDGLWKWKGGSFRLEAALGQACESIVLYRQCLADSWKVEHIFRWESLQIKVLFCP